MKKKRFDKNFVYSLFVLGAMLLAIGAYSYGASGSKFVYTGKVIDSEDISGDFWIYTDKYTEGYSGLDLGISDEYDQLKLDTVSYYDYFMPFNSESCEELKTWSSSDLNYACNDFCVLLSEDFSNSYVNFDSGYAFLNGTNPGEICADIDNEEDFSVVTCRCVKQISSTYVVGGLGGLLYDNTRVNCRWHRALNGEWFYACDFTTISPVVSSPLGGWGVTRMTETQEPSFSIGGEVLGSAINSLPDYAAKNGSVGTAQPVFHDLRDPSVGSTGNDSRKVSSGDTLDNRSGEPVSHNLVLHEVA